jgi:citrate lyase subunit beta / citryl-CoA lyase
VSALTWGSEDLSAALGASGKFDAAGALTFTFQLARSHCLLAASALGVQAIDGVYVNFRETEGLQREASEARRDGFTGKLAIHPDQIDSINTAFTPTESELARARRIVAAFAASPGAGVLNLEGEMIDRPHLLQARRLLDLAGRTART